MPHANPDSMLAKIANYTEILAKDPRSTVFVPLSEAFRQMGLLEDALEVAAKGVKAVPRFSPGHVAFGRVLFESGDVPAALAAFEMAYALDAESLPAIKGLARTLARMGSHERARELLQQGARLDPDDAAIRQLLATCPSPQLQSASTVQPKPGRTKEPIATSTIAEIYLQQGFPERALKVYRDLLANHPGNLELQQKVAAISKMAGQNADPDVKSGRESASESAPVSASEAASGQAEKLDAGGAHKQEQKKIEAADIGSRQVEALNSWLTAIRARRQHVLQ